MTPIAAANLMRIISVGFFGTALVFASGAFPGLDGVSIWMHDLLDFPLDGSIEPFTREARWFSAIGGGVFASLCVLLFMVVAPAVERQDKEIIRGAVVALVAWFIIDSAGSVAAGVPANALFNVSFLVVLLAPLLLARRPARQAAT